MAMKARFAIVLAVAVFAGLACQSALGYWNSAKGDGNGGAAAATLEQGATPTVEATSSTSVVVSWAARGVPDGVPADGYMIKRYDAESGVQASIGASCTGTVAGLTCTESNLPAGNWKYTVTPRLATNWAGAESAKSAAVNTGAAYRTVDLGEAADFAVLGASTVTSAGVSALDGDLGVSPGTAVTGFRPPGTVSGAIHSNDPAAKKAQADLGLAYTDAAGRSPATPSAAALGGRTLTRGAYEAATFTVNGVLTLDGRGDPSSVFIFQAGSTLGTGALSQIDLINGAQACNVFWQVGSSATLGATSTFVGNILAYTSISMGAAVAMDGRALAHNGAVTLINDTVTAPQCKSTGPDTPTDAVLTAATGPGAQSISGSKVFYNPAAAGSFDVDTTATSPAGIAKVEFPAITGFAGGGAVTTPASGSDYRTTYSWSANEAEPSPGAQAIWATDNEGQTGTDPTEFTLVKDGAGPSGGSVKVTGLGGTGPSYSTPTTLGVSFATGTDHGAGVAPGGQLLRAAAPLTSDGTTDGACGTFGAYVPNGSVDPVSPVTDVVPADRSCYRYEYVVADKVGNVTTYVAPGAKVDTTAPPSPALSFSAFSNTYWSGAGSNVFYRPGASSGGFILTATSADPTAGISGYSFPALPSGWTSTSGATGVRNYSWSAANPTAPSGAQAVAATNNAGLAAASTFTLTADSTAPAGGSVTYADGSSNGTTLAVSFTPGTDAQSGIGTTSGILERATATFAANACGSFGAFTVLATAPASGAAYAVASGTCYEYRYSVADNVGNRVTYTSTSVAKVDSAAPVDAFSLESAVDASQSGSTIYYRSNATGSFEIIDAPTDAASGPGSATFPAIATTGWAHALETVATPAGGPYASSTFQWIVGASSPGTKTFFSTDLAGNSSSSSLTFTSDTVAPAGGSITYANGLVNSTSVPIATTTGTDAASGVNTATTTIRRDVATLVESTETCGTFPGTYATAVTLAGGADTGVTSGHCYRYEYLVADKVGNVATYASASVAQVDTLQARELG
jgi:Ice-binding-like